MKSFAIISEFNPFHNGHKYILEKAKEITKADIAISFMSGDFVQRGEPALIDKFLRAESSLEEGFDLVIEMPNFITLQSAKFFAKKSLEIIEKLGVDYLCFGIENISPSNFLKYSNLILDNEDIIHEKTKEYLDMGLSYGKSNYQAIFDLIDNKDFISSNNVLALEYVKALKDLNSKIEPIPITRLGANNSEEKIADEKFASSFAIRNNIESDFSSLVPLSSFEKIEEFRKVYKSFPNYSKIYDFFRYKLLIEKNDIKCCLCYEEGMENLLIKNAKVCHSFEEFISKTNSKRFTNSRIKRLIINYLIENESYLNNIYIDFVKILASNSSAMDFLKNKNIKTIIKKNDQKKLDPDNKIVLDKMITSSNLYSLIIKRDLDFDFTRKFYIKK